MTMSFTPTDRSRPYRRQLENRFFIWQCVPRPKKLKTSAAIIPETVAHRGSVVHRSGAGGRGAPDCCGEEDERRWHAFRTFLSRCVSFRAAVRIRLPFRLQTVRESSHSAAACELAELTIEEQCACPYIHHIVSDAKIFTSISTWPASLATRWLCRKVS